MEIKLACVFKKLPGDKIIVAYLQLILLVQLTHATNSF